MIDWSDPDWGKEGSNVHHSSDGSWSDGTEKRSETS